jgi:hypothetical protein
MANWMVKPAMIVRAMTIAMRMKKRSSEDAAGAAGANVAIYPSLYGKLTRMKE